MNNDEEKSTEKEKGSRNYTLDELLEQSKGGNPHEECFKYPLGRELL